MYKVIALVAMLMVVFFSEFAFSDSNEKYCSIMYAIYGVCSPELVANYLIQTAPQVYHAPRVIPQVKPSLAIASSVPTLLPKQTLNKTEPNVRYTWYWNNKEWVRGRLVG
jgi:hypothetical protein